MVNCAGTELSDMAPIDKELFRRGEPIEGEDVLKLQVLNGEEAVDAALKRFGWTGRAAGCIILRLGADNRSATAGQFAARGRLAREEVRLDAAKIWKDAEAGYTLSIKIPDGGQFGFGGGGLCSDFLDDGGVEHCVTASGRGGQAVLQDERADKGIGAFCLRLVCHIVRATRKSGVTLAYSVLIYPGSAEEVTDVSDLAGSPSWPGIKAADGEMPLLPFAATRWGCPVLPLIRTGSPWEEEPVLPEPEELIARISWIMATSEPPEVCKTKKSLLSRWQKYSENPDEFTAKRGPLSWPKPQQSRQTGRMSPIILARQVIYYA